MSKPILNNIPPFDANNEYDFTFSYSGTIPYKNRLIIFRADSLEIVYDNIITTFRLFHTLPAHTISNGIKYIAQIQTLDRDDVPSPLSDKIFFYPLETPLFNFIDLPSEINDASYNASVNYFQNNDERIRSYRFSLYNSSGVIISESEEMYDQNNLTYTFRGLDSDTSYKIRCYGTTVNGMSVDTGYVSIYVRYITPSTYATIYVENDANNGYIKYRTNIIVIEYNGEDVFQYDGGKIIIDEDKKLFYDKGFNICNDFTIKIKGKNLYQIADIFEAINNDHRCFKISSYIYDDQTIRFKLTVENGLCEYIIYSDPLNITNEDMITIVVRKANDFYDINVF